MDLRLICVIILLWSRIRAINVIGLDATVTAGGDAELFCQLVDTTEPLTSITWQRRTKEKPTNTDFYAITLDGRERRFTELGDRVKFTGDISGLIGSIIISNVTILDEGIYTCIFSIFPSGPFEREIRVGVQVPPVVSVPDVPAVAGDTEEILATCTAANAKPAAEVSWNLGDLSGSVKVQSNVTVDSEGRSTVKSSLIGKASKDLNQKKVQCLVKHPGLTEELELNYTLIIHYPPQVVYIISVGDQGEFQCEGDANPKPTNFNWSRHFPVKEPLSSSVNSRLIIQQTPDSNGLYYCVASNQYGEAVGSVYVRVTYTESTTCWTLFFIASFAVICGILIWKYNLHQAIIKRLRHIRHSPGRAVPPDQASDEVS